MKTFQKLLALTLSLALLMAIAACGKGNETGGGTADPNSGTTLPPLDYTTTNPTETTLPPADTTGGAVETDPPVTQIPPVDQEEVQGMTAADLVKHSAEIIKDLYRFESAMTEQLSVQDGSMPFSYRTTAKRILNCLSPDYLTDSARFRYFSTRQTEETYKEEDPTIVTLDQITVLNNTVWMASGTATTPWKVTSSLGESGRTIAELSKKDFFTEDLTLYFNTLTKTDLNGGGYRVDFDGVKEGMAQTVLSSFHDAIVAGMRLPQSTVLSPSFLQGSATYDANGLLCRVEFATAFTASYGEESLTASASSVRTYTFSETVTDVTEPADKDSYQEHKETTPVTGMVLYGTGSETYTLTDHEVDVLREVFAELTWQNTVSDDYVTLYVFETATDLYILTDDGAIIDQRNHRSVYPGEDNEAYFNTVTEIIERYFEEDEENIPQDNVGEL